MSSKIEREIKQKLAQVEEQILGGWTIAHTADAVLEHMNYRALLSRRLVLVELINFIEDERKKADASDPGEESDDD